MTENKRFELAYEKGNWWAVRDGDITLWKEEVIHLLNGLSEENEQLKEQLEICKDARQAYKQDWKACVSYCDTYKDEIHTLKDNIQGLIEENKVLKNNVEKLSELCVKYDFKVGRLEEENEQLKQRNDRQAKQLDRLYSLVEEKDWTALSDIIDDFKRCEEQLQKEWGTYDDSE